MKVKRILLPLCCIAVFTLCGCTVKKGDTEMANLTKCQSNLKAIATACEMYATENNGHYPDRLDRLVPEYLEKIPACPKNGGDSYSVSYESSQNPDAYTFCCKGSNHTGANLPEDYPQFSGLQGLIEKP